MSSFTPGPWAVSKNEQFVFGQKQGNGLMPIGFIYGPACAEHSDYGKQCIANVHLCASAPDLLEALRDMLSGWKYIRETHGDLYGVGWDRAQGKAEEAIARATGETA